MKRDEEKCDNLEINRKAFFAHLSDFTLVSTRSGRQEDLTGGHCGAAWRGERSLKARVRTEKHARAGGKCQASYPRAGC